MDGRRRSGRIAQQHEKAQEGNEKGKGKEREKPPSRPDLAAGKPYKGILKRPLATGESQEGEDLPKETADQRLQKRVKFDDTRHVEETYHKEDYDRKPSKGILDLNEDVANLNNIQRNTVKLYTELREKLGPGKLTEQTGIGSKNINESIHKAKDTIDLIKNAIKENKLISNKHIDALLKITKEAEDMEKKLEELAEELKKPERQESRSEAEEQKPEQ
jgi:hypothetical protein